MTRPRPIPLASILPLALAAPLAALALSANPTTAQQRLSLDHYMDMETVSNPQISPDGGRIVYTKGWIDERNDRRESALWMMNADGTRQRHLVDGGGGMWSPDGTRILYTAAGEPGGSQLHVRWMDAEGLSTPITRLENGPSNPRWSPDGNWIAFTSRVSDRADFAGVDLPARPDGAQWEREPKVVERPAYKRDGVGYIDTGWTHVFVVPAGGGTPRQLTDGDWNHSSIEWSPDGTEIYFTSFRHEDADRPEHWQESEIYAVSVASGEIRQLTDRHGPDGSPVASPDGSLIAYTGIDAHDDTYRNQKIYVMNRDGSGPRVISGDYDRQVGPMTWAPDGGGLYFNVSRDGYRQLHFVSLEHGVSMLTSGEHLFAMSSFSDDGVAVGTISNAHEPGDIYRFNLTHPEAVTRLTDVHSDVLGHVQLGEVEEVWYDSTDDFQIQGWIVKPPDFDPSRKYPMMLVIHGGPHAMYNGGFNFAFQEHAANDYVVLYTNPRGSTGYGTGFANAINHDYPGADFPDLMGGVDEMLARGYVDEENVFVYGCSGGGILTSYIVGNTDRFRAASANCPIVNWISAMGTSDAISYFRTFEKPFWEDPAEWIDRSSIFYVGNVTTPTMFLTGEMDIRTPMPQTEEMYQALQYLGVPTVMVRFQGEWHGTSRRPSNFLRTQLYLRKWFEKWGSHKDPMTTEEGGR
ncbi:MAG: S9 family peptidase [Gemmatimonadetes bacterium]|nr:S9 family peptidase [Gemmatimonadota bacterium]MYA43400.1 S9 family peptidase [Gemmatimonadota bacterium]MYE92615.1 S9 family peptidase [Gemmatimonadota bacterium]MYJ12706.1 S9 family peptidase [Gemmatimonadota bacterium]